VPKSRPKVGRRRGPLALTRPAQSYEARDPAATVGWAPQRLPLRHDTARTGQGGAPGRWRVGRATFRAALITGAFAAALLGLPGSPAADWSPAHEVDVDRVELQNVQEIRDRLERRKASQHTLQGQARALAAELEALRERDAQMSAMLEAKRQRAQVLEQRLDHIVPRLLARVAEVRARRARAAQALAELASRSRQVQLDSTSRSRMLAISPLMLKRLRSLESSLGTLRGLPERMIDQHSQIMRGLSELTTAQQRLADALRQKERLRHVALAELRGLEAEVRRLGDEQARLARRLLRARAAIVARAEPQANQRALPDLAWVGEARVRAAALAKGALAERPRLAREDQAEYRSAAGILAAAQGVDRVAPPASLAGEPGPPTMRPAGRPAAALRSPRLEVWPSATRKALGQTTPLDIAFEPDRSRSGIGSASRGGDRDPLPLLVVPQELQRRALPARARPEMTILAAPGQGIAAPVDGRIVFAERFKSYGLLLIIEHEHEYHTLLWGFARLDVSLGERVQVGQVVGIMGASGDDPPVLHVERRRNGRPINLAAGSSGIQG
jgi:murein hydrolase activator